MGDEKIARPDRIIVYDFAASPADVPADSVLAGRYAEHGTPQTQEEIEAGRKLGAQVAQELAAKIRDMGLPAVQAAAQGLRPLGSREIEAEGGKTSGVLVPVAVVAATGNPVGLIVGTAANLLGETGSETLEGAAKRTAEEIAEELRDPFEKQGWI